MGQSLATDASKAKALLTLLDGAQFPGAQRHFVVELADWLEEIRDGELVVTTPPDGYPTPDQWPSEP